MIHERLPNEQPEAESGGDRVKPAGVRVDRLPDAARPVAPGHPARCVNLIAPNHASKL